MAARSPCQADRRAVPQREILRTSFAPARLGRRNSACRARRIGFQLLPLLEVFTVFLPTLAKLLSLGWIHRLKSRSTLFSPAQLFERRGHREAISVGCLPALGEFSLRRPVAWRPGVFIVA